MSMSSLVLVAGGRGAAATITINTKGSRFCCRWFQVHCSTSSDSNPTQQQQLKQQQRGFGAKNDNTTTNNKNKKNRVNNTSRNKKDAVVLRQQQQQSLISPSRKSTTQQSATLPSQAPVLSSRFSVTSKTDLGFEERLEAVRRSALEQKKAEEIKEFGPIDYDAPVESEQKTIGIGTKIGVGVAVLVFGLVFALGDFLPSRSDSPTEEALVSNKKVSEGEKAALQTRLKQFEETLSVSPGDPIALEGAAVTLTELGEYRQAASLLQDLSKKKPSDPDVFRLLGEVQYELQDYVGSVAAYKSAAEVSKKVNFEVLRGLTYALLADKKPDEAVQVLLASRQRLRSEISTGASVKPNGNADETESGEVDPIQVDLLLGKAYSDWGHVSDAVAVYDQLISSHPDDFRGYLAKGIILKENGNSGDAERMFIQARFLAPEKAKALVDRFARK